MRLEILFLNGEMLVLTIGCHRGAKGIAIDANDNIYVGTLSEYGVRLYKFDSSGNFVARIGDPMTGLRSLIECHFL